MGSIHLTLITSKAQSILNNIRKLSSRSIHRAAEALKFFRKLLDALFFDFLIPFFWNFFKLWKNKMSHRCPSGLEEG